MKLHKILNFNETDSDGDYFEKNSLQFENPIIVIEGFDRSKAIGMVDIIETEDGLFADLSQFKRLKGYYPAIGFQATKTKVKTGLKSVYGKIFCIGICLNTNTDKKILPL